MSDIAEIKRSLQQVVVRMLPRMLSQVCRDPNSPAYGAFDRDWWHYKIRDFPSIILQQGSYALWVASHLARIDVPRAELVKLAAAGCRFWNARAARRGSFEEYYPWEEGYPPLAFSTLAVMKLADAGVVRPEAVRDGAAIAARQLLARFEPEAANQQVAGLAALAVLAKVFPDLVPSARFEAIASKTLALQTDEGWFTEYGGPDLGYLSVTLDCLWDLYDTTHDRRYLESASRALAFMAPYGFLGPASIGMHNARNTDYILPYGLLPFVIDRTPDASAALQLFGHLYGDLSSPSHFVHAIDDRYLCHYSGHSLFRACLLLETRAADLAAAAQAASTPPKPAEILRSKAGHYLRASAPSEGVSLIVSLKKGGIFTARQGNNWASDFGWLVAIGPRQYVNHWWSDQWRWTREGNAFEIEGSLVPHGERTSSPWPHIALRLLSFCFGRRLIGALKDRLIFKKHASAYSFSRHIAIERHTLSVTDRIANLPPYAEVRPAPRSSKRHVASADSYHEEDLALLRGATCERTTRLDQGTFTAQAVYEFPGSSGP